MTGLLIRPVGTVHNVGRKAALALALILSSNVYAGQVGTTTGSFEVTADGQASYSVGIEVPPGIMGVEPQVSISYSSGGGNGLLGLGGNLSGLSSISRCGRTVGKDQVARPVQYDSTDYFCLNGQRLILMSGVYGAPGSTYQTEVESFQRVTAMGSIAGGPAYFEVLGKAGSKLVFGKSLSGTHLERNIDAITGVVASWGVSYIEDRHGNRVVYDYQEFGRTIDGAFASQVLPIRIRYGINAREGVNSNLKVVFQYEQRPDSSVGYSRGSLYLNDERLSYVETSIGHDVVKYYQITYDQADIGGQSRIKTIRECSGGDNCLLPVTFSWNDHQAKWDPAAALPFAVLTTTGGMRGAAIDVDNDGRTDWVSAVRSASGVDTLVTYLNPGEFGGTWSANNNFVPPAPLFDYQADPDGVSKGELVDYNGDGLVDWVIAYTDANGPRNEVYLNTGSSWQYDASLSLAVLLSDLNDLSNPKQLAEFVDLNADGLPDLVASYRDASGTVTKATYLNKFPTWEFSSAFQTPSEVMSPANDVDVSIDYQLYNKGAVTGFFVDINNDGLTDYVKAYRDNSAQPNNLKTWINTGSGWRVSSQSLPAVIANYATTTPEGVSTLVDINGDGLVDVVQAHKNAAGQTSRKTWLNKGNGWKYTPDLNPPAIAWEQVGSTTQARGFFADLSNDGIPDFVESYVSSSGSSSTVWRNTGDGWDTDSSIELPSYLTRLRSGGDSYALGMMMDINSDGRGDLVMSSGGSSSSVSIAGLGSELFALPDVVTSFTDGLGNSYDVEYSPSTFGDVYTPYANGSYPNIDVAGPLMLVSAVEAAVGVNVSSRAEHQYFGKKVNVTGFGDLGFARKRVLDTRTNVYLETEFYQQWPYTGSAAVTRKITSDGIKLMESSSSYQTKSLFGGKTFLIYQDQKSGSNYELDGQEIDTITSQTTSLDDYGNVLSTTTTKNYKGEHQNGDYTSTTTLTYYANDEASWKIGRLSSKTETVQAPGQPSVSNKESYTYDSLGNLETKVLQPDEPDAVTEVYQYDNFGHITSTTISATGITPRVTTATYTADGRFAASATNPLGHTAHSEYHPHFGGVTRTEGPNGSVNTKLYDDLGRLIKSTQIRTEADAVSAEDHANNVITFHPCPGTNPNCPSNAAYFLGVVDNEGEAPETVYYDNQNREVRKQTQGFDGTSVFVDTVYDSYGRKFKTSKPYFKGATSIHWTKYEYDLLGRVKKVTLPSSAVVRSYYGVGWSKTINPANQESTTYINGQSKPVKVVDNKGQHLDYTYDSAGRLLTTIANGDPSTQITVTYDSFGRKIQQIDPDLGTWEYDYDALGQLIWQKDAKSQVTTMVYDKLGRITQRTEPDAVTNWQYDQGDNAIGKLNRVWNDQGYSRDQTYDDYGRPAAITTTQDGQSATIERTYHHTTDRIAYITYPSGLQVRKEFNEYGFPLSIRSTKQNYYQRYLEAEADAVEKVDAANDYRDDTEAQRADLLETFETEKADGEAVQVEIAADERRYHRELPGYNAHIRRQIEAVDKAKHFERWGNSFREDALNEQRKSLINAYAAEFAAEQAQGNTPVWSSFSELTNELLWPNGGGLDELKRHLANVLGLSQAQLPLARDYVSAADLAYTAEWLIAHAENHGKNATRQMNEASARYDQLKVHAAAAEAHAKHAKTYYNTRLRPITNRIEALVQESDAHFQAAKDAGEELDGINTHLKGLVDAATNAQRQAQALKNYYNEEASDLHWLAQSADAEGKVLKFTQGKHVTTNIEYEASTGRLHSVLSESVPEPITLEADQTVPAVSNRLSSFLSDLSETRSTAVLNAQESLEEKTRTEGMIGVLDANASNLSPAMQLATQAQIDVLNANLAVHSVDHALNQQIIDLVAQTELEAQSIQSQFDALEPTQNNTLVYSARVHSTIANYHTDLKSLYETAAAQQTQYALNVTDIETVDSGYLQEYSDLGDYHSLISTQYQSRADAITITDGSDAASPGLFGMAKASKFQKRIIDRHADITNKRRRLNVALFAPLQHLNEATRFKFANTAAEQHFADAKWLGRNDRERYKRLEKKYRDRLSLLEVTETEDEDIFASDSERKALYEYLAEINAELGEMYTDMADPTYWDSMFASVADGINDRSEVYSRLASNHHQLAANNELLASRSSEQYDHGELGNDDTILNDSYEWDVLGNLTERVHSVADLTETFQYDELNRLTQSSITGSSVKFYDVIGRDLTTYEYDALGNISYKSDVGTYQYGDNAGPHAVTSVYGAVQASYQYDANGNMVSGDGRSIQYTSFNKPSRVEGDGNPTDFVYGPERQLVKQVEHTGVVPKTTYYFGNTYERIYDGYVTTEKYHLSTHNGGVIAVLFEKENEAPKTHYLHRDHLDSIVAITNEKGYVVERFFYDAFGKQLTAVNTDGNKLYGNTIDSGLTDRGFTGHRTIQSGLIHMGGRVFDPLIARFLSADPHIQFAGNMQNYNRYSYVNNNPLSFNDPSGYFISGIFKALKKMFKKLNELIKKVHKQIKKIRNKIKAFVKKYYKVIIAVAISIFVPVAGAYMMGATSLGAVSATLATASLGQAVAMGAIAGGLSSLVMTGSLTAALKGAAFGAITAGVAYGFKTGNTLARTFGSSKRAAQITAHGLIGGTRAKVDGRSFSKGFLSAAVAKGLTPSAVNAFKNNVFVQGFAVATVGGIAANIAGGSFEQGFLAAGVAFSVNNLLSGGEGLQRARQLWRDTAEGLANGAKQVWSAIYRYIPKFTLSFGGELTVALGPVGYGRGGGIYFTTDNGNGSFEMGSYETESPLVGIPWDVDAAGGVTLTFGDLSNFQGYGESINRDVVSLSHDINFSESGQVSGYTLSISTPLSGLSWGPTKTTTNAY